MEKNWMSRNAFKIVFVVFAAFAATLFYLRKMDVDGREALDAPLFRPYFAAIASGDFEKAREFWTEGRRLAWSSADMAAHFADVARVDGKFREYKLYNVRGSTVDVQVFFEHRLYPVAYTIEHRTDGAPRIASAGWMQLSAAGPPRPW